MNATSRRSMNVTTSISDPAVGLAAGILDYLRGHHAAAWSLLIDGRILSDPEDAVLQDLNDLIYSLYYLDWPIEPGPSGLDLLKARLQSSRLAGGLNGPPSAREVSVHGTAYTLGALALLKTRGHDLFDAVMTPESWSLDEIVDVDRLLPKWPAKWSHHNWRVSHWVGGAISILYELSRQMPDAYQASGAPDVRAVLESTDRLIDSRTGLLRCYRSRLLQMAFRQAYRLRHDPMLGDIGGVVHVHWVNYASGRPFKAGDRLYALARDVMLARRPFMERAPYCLDFDVVQIVRTAMPKNTPTEDTAALRTRADAYARDVVAFLEENLDPAFALHKLPGALATVHECALIEPSISLFDLGLAPSDIPPKDIMNEVAWL